jgi:hypothetical protein
MEEDEVSSPEVRRKKRKTAEHKEPRGGNLW